MKNRNTGFYMETFLLIAAFFTVILMISRVFALSRYESVKAKTLTNAVILAENGAEAFLGTRDTDALFTLLNENDNAVFAGDHTIRCEYDAEMKPTKEGSIQMEIVLEEEGSFVEGTIRVKDESGVLYELETGKVRP